MSSNRLRYDDCAYVTAVKESTGSLEYNLFKGKYENCKDCGHEYPNIIDVGNRTNVENELFGLNRINGKCKQNKYDPTKEFNNPKLSPTQLCSSIYYITPNNLKKPTTNMLNEDNLGLNVCSAKTENYNLY